jgi:hypothetical protein
MTTRRAVLKSAVVGVTGAVADGERVSESGPYANSPDGPNISYRLPN